jgi:outer membrane protein assembly factor BamA
VEDTEYQDLIFFEGKVNSVGKSAEESTSNALVSYFVQPGIQGNPSNIGVQLFKELIAKATRSLLIPTVTYESVFLDLRKEAQLVGHLRA